MSTSASRPDDDHGQLDDLTTGGPTSPGPDSGTAAPTGGDGTAVAEPDTGPGPAAADVNDGAGSH